MMNLHRCDRAEPRIGTRRTIGEVLSSHNEIGPGFDFLRVALALSIVFFHAWTVTNQYYHPIPLEETPIWIVHYSLVPMFFALSGFLISASALRLDLKNFLINRGIRIVPALAVDTFVCALLIGPLFTTVSLGHYFGDREFFTYFLNMLGWVHYDLPGVFKDLPVARVNGSLWTVPFELMCYLIMTVMIATNIIRNRRVTLVVILAYLVIAVVVQYSGVLALVHQRLLKEAASLAFLDVRAQTVTAFLIGVAAYQNRDRIPYDPRLFAGCWVFLAVVAVGIGHDLGQGALFRILLLPALVYVTIFTGLTTMGLPQYFKTGDYSYGIYLYHQPFLQIMLVLFPAMALAPMIGSSLTFVAALPLVLGFAWLSWHLVEKPLLALRKRYSVAAKLRAAEAEAARGERAFG